MRAVPILGLASRAALGRAGASLRRRLGNETAVAAFHERNALRFAEQLSDARGLLMKAGQLLSFVQPGDMVSAESWAPYQHALASLRADVEPMDFGLIAAVLETELGAPIKDLFQSFDETPFAAASIGQVHAGRLHDGTEVAVKVQYPGVANAIEADLANTDLLATTLKLVQGLPGMPKIDPRAMASELRDRVREELDYEQERRNLEEFAAYYADLDAVRIPKTYPALCTERVLTMGRAIGLGWDDALKAPQHLRDRWGGAIDRFFFRSIYRHSVFHADPHPGNYIFHTDGTVTVVDFGCINRFDDDTLAGFVGIAESTIKGDAERLAAILHHYGFVGDDAPSPEELLAWYRPTFSNMLGPQPCRVSATYGIDVLNVLNPLDPDNDIARRFSLPPQFLLATRIYVGLFTVLAALEAEADWRVGYDADLRDYHQRVADRALPLSDP